MKILQLHALGCSAINLSICAEDVTQRSRKERAAGAGGNGGGSVVAANETVKAKSGAGVVAEASHRKQRGGSRAVAGTDRYAIGPHGTSVAAYPIGIDPERFISAWSSGVSRQSMPWGPGLGLEHNRLRRLFRIARENGPPTVTDTKPPTLYQPSASSSVEQRKIILGVDRLDYVKGIPEKLEAFERYLDRYPEK